MNNSQFRRLVLDAPGRDTQSNDGTTSQSSPLAGPSPGLGSRMRASMPMTPRSVTGFSNNDFKRQLAERAAEQNENPTKKFRSSAAPKGTKLAVGYTDRASARQSASEDEKGQRVAALEEMVRLGQMDETMFMKLRDEIVGGDISNVHLVKGLDYNLLARVRQGEDAYASTVRQNHTPDGPEAQVADKDIDEALNELGKREVATIVHAKEDKQGVMAPPPSIRGKKRSRNEILAELKAKRIQTQEQTQLQQPALSSKFRKVGPAGASRRIERDAKGREVLIVVDVDGNVKRKVRKPYPSTKTDLPMPDKNAVPLGLHVETTADAGVDNMEANGDTDIFEGIGTDFDPLGERSDSEQSEGSVDAPSKPDEDINQDSEQAESDTRRNYFNDSPSETADNGLSSAVSLKDPTILSALKKVSAIASASEPGSAVADSERTEADREKAARRKAMLESYDRDAADLDMGFGGSRLGDEDDAAGDRDVRLSKWNDGGGKGGDEGEAKQGGKPSQRKRGPKKRKGKGDSAADVMKVLERRKQEKA